MHHATVVTAVLLSVSIAAAVGSSKSAEQDDNGFVRIFNARNLSDWYVVPEKHAADWSVRDGLLIGNGKGKGSNLVWKGEAVGDFELNLEYRFRTQGNSGIHVRGRATDPKSLRVHGYHADFGHVGIGKHILGAWDFHGAPRGSQLVHRGQRVVIDAKGEKRFTTIEGALTPEDVRERDWNEVHVVARGNRLYFTINGKIASEVIDNEPDKRLDTGGIALQLHGGPPMTVEFRKIRLKRLVPQSTNPPKTGLREVRPVR